MMSFGFTIVQWVWLFALVDKAGLLDVSPWLQFVIIAVHVVFVRIDHAMFDSTHDVKRLCAHIEGLEERLQKQALAQGDYTWRFTRIDP